MSDKTGIDKKVEEYREIVAKKLDDTGIMLAVDIFDKFEFSRYCKKALLRQSLSDEHMINSDFYRALWVGFLYVVIEGLEGSSKIKDPRLIKYELYYDEIVTLSEFLDKPFKKSDTKLSKRKVLKNFRNYLFHADKKAHNSVKNRKLEINFPNIEINEIMKMIESIFLDFRAKQSCITGHIKNLYMKDMFESLGLKYPIEIGE